ncbi:MAG: DUF1858 domain-containing protein [Ruminiclostridium sp.]|nr:DUF1858 domain-containing protein [Ruminiclostridium sp.]
MVVTKDTLIGEILQENAEAAAPYFFAIGMHCLGCPASVGETIEEACLVHDADPDELVENLNKALA